MKHFTLSLLMVSLLVTAGGCSRFGRRHTCRRSQPCDMCPTSPTCDECQTLGAASANKPAYLASNTQLQFPRSVRSRVSSEAPDRLLPVPKSAAGGYYPKFLVPDN